MPSTSTVIIDSTTSKTGTNWYAEKCYDCTHTNGLLKYKISAKIRHKLCRQAYIHHALHNCSSTMNNTIITSQCCKMVPKIWYKSRNNNIFISHELSSRVKCIFFKKIIRKIQIYHSWKNQAPIPRAALAVPLKVKSHFPG